MLGFEIGLSGIRANQTGLDVTSNNIANADNPNYHRQLAELAARPGVPVDNLRIGSGVDVSRIRRSFALLVQDSIAESLSEQSSVTHRYAAVAQAELLLSPGGGALRDRVESFYNQLTELTANPSDQTRRQIVVERGTALTEELNNISQNLERLRGNTQTRVRSEVDLANRLFAELSGVVKQIRGADFENAPPNQLLDRRDEILGELSQIVDIKLYERGGNEFSILAGNQKLFVGNEPVRLETSVDENGALQFFAAGIAGPVEFQGGSLQGLAEVTNALIPEYLGRLDSFARNLALAFDQAHTTGVNALGGFELLQSTRNVSNAAVPLSQATPSFSIQQGELFVGITNKTTGDRTLQRIFIDPQTDSLIDLAGAINALDGVRAVVDPKQGTLTVSALNGFQFDFAGRLPSQPALAGISGTAVPSFSGQYTGPGNQELTFSVSGSGEIGQADPLTLQVLNAAGDVLNEVNLGAGYVPGSTLEVLDGINVSLAAGSLNDGDTFSTYAVADADSTDVLVALGLNTFFSGERAGDLRVNDRISKDHRLLASSVTGDIGDAGNVLRLLNSRHRTAAELQDDTLEGFLDKMIRDVGSEAETLRQEQTDLTAQLHRLESEKASVVGVDPNEEFVRLMQYQRAFEMSSRIISMTDQNIQALLSMVG